MSADIMNSRMRRKEAPARVPNASFDMLESVNGMLTQEDVDC